MTLRVIQSFLSAADKVAKESILRTWIMSRLNFDCCWLFTLKGSAPFPRCNIEAVLEVLAQRRGGLEADLRCNSIDRQGSGFEQLLATL